MTAESFLRREARPDFATQPDTTFWHPSMAPHVTMTGSSPLLALWFGTRDTASPTRLKGALESCIGLLHSQYHGMSSPMKGKLRQIVPECGYLLVNLVLLALVHAPASHNSDEGVILNGAWNLFNGRSLYSDFFEYVPPGSFYLVYGTWLLTGAHEWAAQLVGILALLIGAAGVQSVTGLIVNASPLRVPSWSVRITPLLFCASSASWPIANHNTFSIVVAIWVCYFLLRAISRQSARDNIIAGCLAGLVFAFLQHRGLAIVAGALGTYLLLWRQAFHLGWLKFALQFAFASLIVPALLLALFSPTVLFNSLYSFPAANYWHVNRVSPVPLLAAFLMIAMVVWSLRKYRSDLILLLAVQQCALLLSIVMRPDIIHVLTVMFPLLCLLPLVVAQFLRGRPASFLNTTSAPYWMTVVVFLGVALRTLVSSTDDTPPMLAYIRDNCASSPYLYAGPFMPGVYFETRKLNATRYSVLFPDLNTEEQFRDAVDSLSRLAVPCAVVNYAMVEEFGYDRDNPVDRYLDQNYQLGWEGAGVRVLRRKGEAPEAGQ